MQNGQQCRMFENISLIAHASIIDSNYFSLSGFINQPKTSAPSISTLEGRWPDLVQLSHNVTV